MDILTSLQHLLFAMFLGAVVGIDREKSASLFKTQKFAGIRTFTLIGLLGALSAMLEKVSIIMFSITLIAFVLLLVASYISHTLQNKQNGGTSELASLIVLITGYFVGNSNYTIACIVIIMTVLLLSCREKIREFATKISKQEMNSIIHFVIIAFIILPLLPNQYYGPLQAFNPYLTWVMIVLVSTISFLSYLAIKLLGPNRGISLSGFLGGFISSTAVALDFASRSKKHSSIVTPFVFGIIVSSSAMFFRLFIAVSIINPQLTSLIVYPLLVPGMMGLILADVLWYAQVKDVKKNNKLLDTHKIDLGKPLDLVAGLKFGLLFAIILLVSKFMSIQFGNGGIYITSIISALVDTDAITVSLSNLSKNITITNHLAVTGIALAAYTNTFMKAVYALMLGSRAVAIRTTGGVLLIIVSGLLSLALI